MIDLPDGRELAWIEIGDPSGKPFNGFHGTLGITRDDGDDSVAVVMAPCLVGIGCL